MSGGGSRAANFSAAVMLELEQLGLLDRATVISSVSGSSLPAAYYGLFGQGKDASKWNSGTIKERMRTNFEASWLWRWFLPNNIAEYWITNFSRSDIMADVFDSNLFEKKKFSDMGKGQPRIVINSTEVSRGTRFTFTEQTFHKTLNSEIENYPIARAVMASSAFPGVFQDVTLRKYGAPAQSKSSGGPSEDQTKDGYLHVIDGGPSDNLGTTTLIVALHQIIEADSQKQQASSPLQIPCFLVVVDAYPYALGSEFTPHPETRGLIDYFFDTNVANSSDALLSARRIDLLNDLGLSARANNPEVAPFTQSKVSLIDKPAVSCAVWYIGLPRMLSKVFRPTDHPTSALDLETWELGTIVNSIPTRFTLVSGDEDHPIPADRLQDKLFEAAHRLVEEDRFESLGVQMRVKDGVCAWFHDKEIELAGCSDKDTHVSQDEHDRH
jgi:hypothetical protein